jgi:glycosyltransferase involved in cell wall biosynthesis
MAVLESLAVGVPVVATPVGALADFLVDGESVLFVPSGDVSALAQGLCRLLTDPALAAQIGEAGKIVFDRNFDITIVAHRFVELWRECVAAE